MRAYFARSIRGEHSGVRLEKIADAIAECGLDTQFEVLFPSDHMANTDEFIYQRDLYWLGKCDVLIAEVTDASHGVGYEIAYAKHVLKIPVLCLAKHGTKVSAMLAGGQQVEHYGEQHLKRIIEAFIASAMANRSTM